jgi:O-antigen ligase|tara:strand:+ start:4506 stop:5930 length:1425 start_codon:yes stop_codon:yes gene_type:complete
LITVKKAYQIFFILGIFFIPFNSNVPKWFGFLGEYSADTSPIFFLIGFVFLLIDQIFKGKLYFPLKSNIYLLFVFFLGVLLLTTLINLPNILQYYFKQTTGIERFIRQMISILISGFIFFYLFINVGKDYGVKKFFLLIRKIFFISFIIVFSCGMFEYLIIVHRLSFLVPIYKLYNYLPFVGVSFSQTLQRLSSVTYEPPALGTYLISISGFMFSYILTSKKKKRFLPFVLVFLLAVLCKSRTALIVVLLQTIAGIAFAYYMFYDFRKIFNKILLYSTIIGLFSVVFYRNTIYQAISERISTLDFTKTDYSDKDNSVSNKSRLGIQTAMFETFKENPIFGTGWGQQAYISRYLYPRWATKQNYEFSTKYLNKEVKSFPPGYNLYLRILTEAGIVGFLAFLLFLYSVFKSTMYTFKKSKEQKYIAVALLICFIGLTINWFQIDSFRQYAFWLCLAMLIIYKKEINARLNNTHTTL